MNVLALPSATVGQVRARSAFAFNLRPRLGSETVILLCSVFFSVFSNLAFWHNAVADPFEQWRLALSLFLLITALHAFLMALVVNRWTMKPLLTALLLVTALAAHYMNAYGVYLDADMLRNVLHTDRRESAELLSLKMLAPLAVTMLPVFLLWRVRLRRRNWRRALAIRGAFLVTMALLAGGGALLSFQEIASLMRNHREVRYLVTPANYVVALSKVLFASPPGPTQALLPIGMDARQVSRHVKPRLLVLVVGETVRAQNWGLSGYVRQTTPELSRVDGLINFPLVTACGTSTEVSLPCMFSVYGHRDYDEKSIRRHQSLLHVLDHAGIATLWRDNQSGCKGVCDGLPTQPLQSARDAELCNEKRCLDEILIKDLYVQLPPAAGDRVVVLHQLGNHGPSYFERYPPQYERFKPACASSDLGQCKPQEIVNAYDNAVLYTDHFLAETIRTLQSSADYDTAMIYVSDHGESLGEKGLFLHGMPWSIAPREQTHVPMVMWFSPGFAQASGLDPACLVRRSSLPASHDNLFPSVLGLMQVTTGEYQPAYDLFEGCRDRS